MLSSSFQPRCCYMASLWPCSVVFRSQGLDPSRVVEILKDSDERRRSRDSLTSVKYESGSETGEEVSMGVEWNGVSTSPLLQSLNKINKPNRRWTDNGVFIESRQWVGTKLFILVVIKAINYKLCTFTFNKNNLNHLRISPGILRLLYFSNARFIQS